MSALLYQSPTVGGHITQITVNGRGNIAYVAPGEALSIKGRYVAQNPVEDPTRQVYILLFRRGEFWKCLYNEVPRAEPDATTGTFTFQCTAPTEPGEYEIKSGWAYNWEWPEDAANFLQANPQNTESIGKLIVGLKPQRLPLTVLALPIIPLAMIIGDAALKPKRGR